MPFKKHKPEEIIGKLREAEIVLAQGASTPARRAAQRRNLLQPRRGPGADRGVAASLQYHPSAQQSGLSPAGPGSRSIASAALRFRFAPPPADTGDEVTMH